MREEKKRFQYKPRNTDAVKKRASQNAFGDRVGIFKDGLKGFSVKEGTSYSVRFLPPTWDDAEHYGYDIYVHYNIGPGNDQYLCLEKMQNKPCPICDERKKAEAEGDAEYAKKLTPTKRVAVYLVDREDEKEGVKVWSMPWTLDRDISKIAVDKKTGELYEVDNPDEGYDVSFEVTGKKPKIEYTGLQIARRASELGNDDWLEFAVKNPIPEQLVYSTYDHIKSVFAGKVEEEKEEKKEDKKDDKKDEIPEFSSKDKANEYKDITYEGLQAASEDDLVGMCLDLELISEDDENNMPEKEELLEMLAKHLKLSAPKKEEKKESYKEKLARLRKK